MYVLPCIRERRTCHLPCPALVIRVPRWQLRMVLDDNLMRL